MPKDETYFLTYQFGFKDAGQGYSHTESVWMIGHAIHAALAELEGRVFSEYWFAGVIDHAEEDAMEARVAAAQALDK